MARAPDFDRALGQRLRVLREARQLSVHQAVSALAAHGAPFHRVTLRLAERGERGITAYELTAFARAYEAPISELLDGLPTISPMDAAVRDEATAKAARRLGVLANDVDDAARRLWGRTLPEERDARLCDVSQPRADQARRGHITRRLIEEIRNALDQTEEPTP